MERALKPRKLPNGKSYCLEISTTERAQDDCAADLEDGFFGSEQDKANGLTLFRKYIRELELARDPCGIFARTFTPGKCRVGDGSPVRK